MYQSIDGKSTLDLILGAYETACLRNALDERNQGTFLRGYSRGINDGLEILARDKKRIPEYLPFVAQAALQSVIENTPCGETYMEGYDTGLSSVVRVLKASPHLRMDVLVIDNAESIIERYGSMARQERKAGTLEEGYADGISDALRNAGRLTPVMERTVQGLRYMHEDSRRFPERGEDEYFNGYFGGLKDTFRVLTGK